MGSIDVLVVDEDLPFGRSIANRLAETSELVQACVATSSRDAVETLETGQYDWVVASTTMPDASFAAFLEDAVERTPHVRVVVLADALTDLEDLGSHSRSLVDVRSRHAVESDPGFFVAGLKRRMESVFEATAAPVDSGVSTVFATHALPMLLIRPTDGAIVAANDAAVDFYGYTRHEFEALCIQDINALPDAEVEARRQEAHDGTTSHFEFPHRLKDGTTRTVEVNATPFAYDGETVLFSIVQDVTARVDAEDALRQARDRYRRLTEHKIVGIYTVEDRRFTYVNPTLADIFGRTPGEMLGTSVFEYVASDDREAVREHLAARETGAVESSHYTFEGVHRARDRVRVEVHDSRVSTDDGVAVIGTMLDVTDRHQYEHDRRRLSQALEYAAPAVYITDTESVITYVNPAFERITGYEESDALGATPELLNSGLMDDSYFEDLYRTLEAGGVWEEAIIDRRKNGELYHAYQTIAPYRNETDEIAGYVAIQSDVTDQRIQEQVLQVFQRIFRHNLRNEITVIRGYVERIETILDDSELAALLSQIDEAAATLQSLSDKATTVVNMLENADEDRDIDVVAVAEQERDRVNGKYPAASITVDGPSSLHVDGGGEVEVVLQELVTNALVHSDTESPTIEISVSTEHDSSTGVVTVLDDGPGVDEEELTTLAVGEESPLQHGSGLGLWLVEWVVTRLGGHVEFANLDPRGLCVELHLPLAAD